MRPTSADFNSREGYGANKVAAEQVLLECGAPVSVLRPSKIHGVRASPAREWYFVRRILDRRPVVLLADRGLGVDHPTAAVNLAALIEVVAHRPGRRILNSADPDAPGVRDIARLLANLLAHQWREVLLDEDAPSGLGRTPWSTRHSVVLDTSGALALGYEPVGTYASTVGAMVSWLVATARLGERHGDEFFDGRFDYEAEDAFLAATT